MTRGPSRFVMIRDSLLLVGGMLGIAYQQLTGNINPILIGVYMTMLGLPGLSSGRWLLRQIGEPPSSSPPSQPSALDSPKSSE